MKSTMKGTKMATDNLKTAIDAFVSDYRQARVDADTEANADVERGQERPTKARDRRDKLHADGVDLAGALQAALGSP